MLPASFYKKQQILYDKIISSNIECISVRQLVFRGEFTNYKIDTFGNVYSLDGSKILVNTISRYGYLMVVIYVRGKHINASVHRLVAETFIPNPNNLPVVNHKDGDKLYPYVTNLEWCTHKYNTQHAIEHGLFNPKDSSVKSRGIDSGRNIHPEERIRDVCKLLEQGFGPTAISRMIPEIDLKSVDSIKRGHNWKHISKDYNIIPPVHRLAPLPTDIVRQIETLTDSGVGPGDIARIIGSPDDRRSYEQIRWVIRKYLNTKMTLTSTTIDQPT